MLDVDGREEISGGDGLDSPANQNAIHLDVVADGEVAHRELVLGGNVPGWSVCLAAKFERVAGFQIIEGDQHVVAGIELEHVERHGEFRAPLL